MALHNNCTAPLSLNPSLIQKGLRRRLVGRCLAGRWFESFPDSEGIKTITLKQFNLVCWFESFPDSEGIKT